MKRRDFLQTGALGLPLQAQAMAQSTPRYNGKPALKITDIQTFLVNAGGRNLCFVKVLTDQGIDGWGEAYSVGPDEATVATIKDFKGWLVGKDPRNVEYLWATMYNFTRFPGGAVINAAISGIEHALWDISGKAAGLPVYMLLGGKCRDKVRVYQGTGGATPQQLAENCKRLIAKYGYTALKMAPHPNGSQSMPWNAVTRAAGQRAEAARNAVGPDIDLGFDAHATLFEPIRAFNMAEAIRPATPYFIEEPIRMENVDALQTLNQKINIPLATGECLYTKYDFRIPMRDGVKLFTVVYLPKDTRKTYPVLMMRTPYSVAGRSRGQSRYGVDFTNSRLGPSEDFDKAGYIFVNQDVRGRHMSQGVWQEMQPHKPVKKGAADTDASTDMHDSVQWLLKNLPGHNGRVGIWGISYPGFYAAASIIDSHPAIKAASPQAPVVDLYMNDDAYHNGAFMLAANYGFYTFFTPQANPTDKTKVEPFALSPDTRRILEGWGQKFSGPQPSNHVAAILVGAPSLGGAPVGRNRFYGANDPRRHSGLAAGY